MCSSLSFLLFFLILWFSAGGYFRSCLQGSIIVNAVAVIFQCIGLYHPKIWVPLAIWLFVLGGITGLAGLERGVQGAIKLFSRVRLGWLIVIFVNTVHIFASLLTYNPWYTVKLDSDEIVMEVAAMVTVENPIKRRYANA